MTAATQTLRVENFLETMNALKGQYMSSISLEIVSEFSLPKSLLVAASKEVMPEEVKKNIASFKETTEKFSEDQEKVLLNKSEKYVEKHDLSSFEKAMQEEKKAAKAKAAEHIEKYYEEMTKMG